MKYSSMIISCTRAHVNPAPTTRFSVEWFHTADSHSLQEHVCHSISIYIHTYIHTYIRTYICVYIYIYIYKYLKTSPQLWPRPAWTSSPWLYRCPSPAVGSPVVASLSDKYKKITENHTFSGYNQHKITLISC